MVAAALVTASTMQLIAANPLTRLPWVGRPEHEPPTAIGLRMAGVVIGLFGGLWLAPMADRFWFGAGVLLILVPTVILQVRHNQSVGA